MRRGPRPLTVTVETRHADRDLVAAACAGRLPKVENDFHKLADGEAYVPEGLEKKAAVVIDVVGRRTAPAR